MGFFNEVLCKTGCVVVVVVATKGSLMLFVSCGGLPASLYDICLIAIGTS